MFCFGACALSTALTRPVALGRSCVCVWFAGVNLTSSGAPVAWPPTFGPVTVSVPSALTLQAPSITSVLVAGVTLPTPGGDSVVVTGNQLGAGAAEAHLVLDNGAWCVCGCRHWMYVVGLEFA